MRLAVLDTNLMGILASRNQALQDRIRTYLCGLRSEGYSVVITDSTLRELAANENPHTRAVTLGAAVAHCDGYFALDADDILKVEALDRVGSSITSITTELVLPIEDLPEVVEEVRKIAGQAQLRARTRLDVRELRQFKQRLDSHLKVEPGQIPPFPDFVREHHLDFLRLYYDQSFKTYEVVEDTLEPLWYRGKGWRIGVLAMMANIHRWATRNLRKGEGSISDIHAVIEAAYADLFLTYDKELAGCGELINQIERTPLIQTWPINQ